MQVVTASDVWAYKWYNIRSVIINVRSVKNDVKGQGHRFALMTNDLLTTYYQRMWVSALSENCTHGLELLAHLF